MRTEDNIFHRVDASREAAGISKNRFSLMLGVTFSEYQRMLKGTRPMRATELWRAATVLQRTMDSFFEEEVRNPEAAEVRNTARLEARP